MWLAAAQLDRTMFSELLAHQLSSHLLQLKNRTETVTSLELESAQKGFEIEDLNRQKAERETHINVLEARVAETREELKVSQSFAADRVDELENTQEQFMSTPHLRSIKNWRIHRNNSSAPHLCSIEN